MKKSVIIVGAGIAGLSAGIYLLQSGFEDTIFEEFKNIFFNLEIKESKTVLLLDNLELIKALLAGKYDDVIDVETKRKLIRRIMENK